MALVCGATPGPLSSNPAAAQAVPPNVLADLRSAAVLAEQDRVRIQETTAGVRDPLLAARLRDENRAQSATTFGYVVSAAIAQHPAAAESILRSAVSLAPDLQREITGTALAAYPGFQAAILAGSESARPDSDRPYNGAAPLIAGPAAQAPRLLAEPRPPVTREYIPPPEAPGAINPVYDPWHGLNRPLFSVYMFLDSYLVRPVAAGYGWVVPDPIKEGVYNAFRNLEAPIILANDLLQFDITGGVTTIGRFAVNSTVGGLGFFDVAAKAGMPGHLADFDQTLNHYGVPGGPYMILPLLGPGTVRHNFGRLVDFAFDPLTWISGVDGSVKIGRAAGDVISKREALIDSLDTMRKDSIDWYATFRAVYYQDRTVVLQKGEITPGEAENDLFDAAE